MTGQAREVDDELYEDAKKIIFEAGRASPVLLQRRLRISYGRAVRLIELMTEEARWREEHPNAESAEEK